MLWVCVNWKSAKSVPRVSLKPGYATVPLPPQGATTAEINNTSPLFTLCVSLWRICCLDVTEFIQNLEQIILQIFPYIIIPEHLPLRFDINRLNSSSVRIEWTTGPLISTKLKIRITNIHLNSVGNLRNFCIGMNSLN